MTTDYFYFEDFKDGQVFTAGSIEMTKENILKYASEFDPQFFHLDEEAAKDSVFGTLVASGWHTASTSMKLFVEAFPDIHGGMIGRTIDRISWPRPTYPGDKLSIACEVKETVPSKSKPHLGIVKMRNTTSNQDGKPVQIADIVMFVPTSQNNA